MTHVHQALELYYYMYLSLYYHVGVFILQAHQLKQELFSSRQMFYVDVQVK